MDLSQITTVTETNDAGDVTRRLGEGWVLLGVASGRNADGEPSTWYSLGFIGREPIE